MKTNKLWLGLAAFALLATGCAKEQVETKSMKGDGNAELVVSIAAANQTRTLLGTSTQAQIDAYEAQVVEFTAYVFDDAGLFIEQGSTNAGTDRVVFPGYAKDQQVQVVAFANSVSSSVSLPALEPGVSDIADAFDALTVTLSSQLTTDFASTGKGLMMSGQYGANTTTGNLVQASDALYTIVDGQNTITVPVERVVAKVVLGDITFGGDITLADLANFSFMGGGIQRAIGTSFIYPGEITNIPAGANYYGSFDATGAPTYMAGLNDMAATPDGMIDLQGLLVALLGGVKDGVGTLLPGLGVVVTPLINTALALTGGTLELTDGLLALIGNIPLNDILPFVPGINLGDLISEPVDFWYVLPNNGSVNPTLLTLAGTYNNADYYYPIVINGKINGTTGDTTDGTFLKRNTIYKVNVQFNSLIGTDNPNDPNQGTNLIVKVDPIEWETTINQNATW